MKWLSTVLFIVLAESLPVKTFNFIFLGILHEKSNVQHDMTYFLKIYFGFALLNIIHICLPCLRLNWFFFKSESNFCVLFDRRSSNLWFISRYFRLLLPKSIFGALSHNRSCCNQGNQNISRRFFFSFIGQDTKLRTQSYVNGINWFAKLNFHFCCLKEHSSV